MMLMMEEIVLRIYIILYIYIHALDPRAFQKWIIIHISMQ